MRYSAAQSFINMCRNGPHIATIRPSKKLGSMERRKRLEPWINGLVHLTVATSSDKYAAGASLKSYAGRRNLQTLWGPWRFHSAGARMYVL